MAALIQESEHIYQIFLSDLRASLPGSVLLQHPFDYRLASSIMHRFNSFPGNPYYLPSMVSSPCPLPPRYDIEYREGQVTQVILARVPQALVPPSGL